MSTPGTLLQGATGDRVWLASCSLAPRTAEARDALMELDEDRRDLHAWERFEAVISNLRAEIALLLGASVDQIALLPSASVAAFQALGTARGTRPTRILTSRAEFPSIAHVWGHHVGLHGGAVQFADLPPGTAPAPPGEIGPTYLEVLDSARGIDLVSAPLVAYDTGEQLPVREIVQAAREIGASTLVDAYQYVGTGPLDAPALGCDFLVAGTSKYLLGLPGLAFLYVRDPARLTNLPLLTGWWGRRDPMAFDHHEVDFPTTARRTEVATLPVASVYTALAGLRLLRTVTPENVRDHRDRLTAQAWDFFESQGRRPVTPREPSRRAAHLAVTSANPGEEAAALGRHGLVCAPRGGLLRFAFHVTNGPYDLDRVAGAMAGEHADRLIVDKGARTR